MAARWRAVLGTGKKIVIGEAFIDNKFIVIAAIIHDELSLFAGPT